MNELEERARTLLRAAADTIEVSLGAPDAERPRTVWPLVAAAVAVAVAVLLVGLPLLLGSSDDPRSRLEPAGPTTVVVPQTYLMTTEQAEATLEAAGLEVQYGTTGMNECEIPEDRVVASDPSAGSSLEQGESVRIDRPGGSGSALCVTSSWDEVTALLDLARFGENRLAFAPSVRLWREGEWAATLTDEHARTGTWGKDSPLSAFVEAVEAPQSFVTTRVFAEMNRCVRPASSERPGGRVSALVVVNDAGAGAPDCTWLGLYRDEDGLITDVAAATSG